MSRLTVYPESQPESPELQKDVLEQIQQELSAARVRFERWQADRATRLPLLDN